MDTCSVSRSQSLYQIVTTAYAGVFLLIFCSKRAWNSIDVALKIRVAEIAEEHASVQWSRVSLQERLTRYYTSLGRKVRHHLVAQRHDGL